MTGAAFSCAHWTSSQRNHTGASQQQRSPPANATAAGRTRKLKQRTPPLSTARSAFRPCGQGAARRASNASSPQTAADRWSSGRCSSGTDATSRTRQASSPSPQPRQLFGPTGQFPGLPQICFRPAPPSHCGQRQAAGAGADRRFTLHRRVRRAATGLPPRAPEAAAAAADVSCSWGSRSGTRRDRHVPAPAARRPSAQR